MGKRNKYIETVRTMKKQKIKQYVMKTKLRMDDGTERPTCNITWLDGCEKMKIKVRTIIKNLATILLLPINLFLAIVIPLTYRVFPWQYWIWGYGDESSFTIIWTETIKYQLLYCWAPLIGICTLIVSIPIGDQKVKNIIRNVSIILLAMPNAFMLYTFGFEMLQFYLKYGYVYHSLENMLLGIWIPLFAFILLAIYSLMWLVERLKGKITLVNE
ncbi:MAG: hypothetical protein ACPLIG_07220 [Candidatus Bathyarchaeales archaeon]